MNFSQLASDLRFPEGPVLLTDGSLLCVEVMGGTLVHIVVDGAKRVVAELGGGPNGAARGPDGRIYVCNNGGFSMGDDGTVAGPSIPCGRIEAVDLQTGASQRLYDRCGETPLMAPNDLVFDQHGGFYFSDFGSMRDLSPQPGHVYYGRTDGTALIRIEHDFERPNGVGLSPDGNMLYVAETSTGRLWALPVLAPGVVQEGITVPLFADPELPLDSLAVQADGRVCVASPGTNCIVRVSADGSAEKIEIPAQGPANICFGGAGEMTAYIACLFSGDVLKAAWDSPGLRLNFQTVTQGVGS